MTMSSHLCLPFTSWHECLSKSKLVFAFLVTHRHAMFFQIDSVFAIHVQ